MRETRIDRFLRGVRAAQVKLRNALAPYPILKDTFLTDRELAERESEELKRTEAALPLEKRIGTGHWSGMSQGLKSVAETVGLGADYAVQYRVNSGSIHASRPWDTVRFDPGSLLVVPSLEVNRDLGTPLAFDALRYLAWLLLEADGTDAVSLRQSEQKILGHYRQFAAPLDELLKKGIVGPGPLSES